MTQKLAAIVVLLLSALFCFQILGNRGSPRALLLSNKLHADLVFLERAGIDGPDDLAAGFFAFVQAPVALMFCAVAFWKKG